MESVSEPNMLSIDDSFGARRLATLSQAGASPGVFWMQGFNSDMISTKATALAEWAEANGVAITRFDYSGHGQSDCELADGSISQWLADTIAVFDHLTEGPQVVIGSSMGGYLAMLLLRALKARGDLVDRIKALVLIAPAWDMTEQLMWAQFPDDIRRTIEVEGVWMRPSAYGDPYPITRKLIDDGRLHLFGGQDWEPGVPIRILQGRLDPDVPYAHAAKLMDMAAGTDIEMIEVPDGDHRLSRAEDLELLIRTVEAVRS